MMTLKELKLRMSCPKATQVPTVKALREMGVRVVDQIDLGKDGVMIAYENGYVVYCSGKHSTVVPVFSAGAYVYDQAEGKQEIEESYFDNQDWYVRMLLEAEDRIEQNHYKKTHCVSYDAESEDWAELPSSSTAENEYLKKEAMKELLDLLTERQREVISMYYLQGETMEAIGKYLGIRKQAVDDARRRAVERCREKLGESFLEVFDNE